MAKVHSGARWFDVDPNGLRDILARKGHGFIVHELVQNAWDADGVKCVGVTIRDDKGMLELTIADDALAGVEDLSDLYTLFAPSKKKHNVKKRGRFNMGEKLAISCANSALVSSTKGTIYFRANGRREYNGDRKLDIGTQVTLRFIGIEKLREALIAAARQMIPPVPTTLILDGKEELVSAPTYKATVTGVQLPTEYASEDGRLHPSIRKTDVVVYERGNELPMLYEMGVPVCETNLPWHVDVYQKIPLTMDRTSVTRPFLRRLGVVLLNNLYQLLTTEAAATEPWVREAASDKECTSIATKHLLRIRFGEKAVAFDPSDPEANMRAVSEGYTVVHGGSMSKGEWTNVRQAEAIKPAGQVTPTHFATAAAGEGGKVLDELTFEQLSSDERQLAQYLSWLTGRLVGPITIRYFRDRGWDTTAGCGSDRVLVVNLARFNWQKSHEIHWVVLHELAHLRESNHLSDEYHKEICRLGARLADVAVGNPEIVGLWLHPGAPDQAAALRRDDD